MWLLEKDVLRKITAGHESGNVTAKDKDGFISAMGSGDGARISTQKGNIAEIKIEGVLTKEPDFFASFFGGGNTSYHEIISAVKTADQDPTVESISLRFNTPGGNVSGLLEAMSAIKETRKKTTAIVDDRAFSAGYSLASQADEIIAANDLSSVGSVGVALTLFSPDQQTTITNRDSPDKIPDEKTDQGKGVIQDRLDSIHNVLVREIALGRAVSEDTVRKEFGRGRVFVAQEAKERGMIDGIESSASQNKQQINGRNEEGNMTLSELKSQHPALYAEAVGLGTNEEKERVKAHLTMGQTSAKCMPIALKAIDSDKGWTASVQAEYLAAQSADKEIDARAKDDEEVGNVNPGAGKDNHDIVADLVAAEMGVK